MGCELVVGHRGNNGVISGAETGRLTEYKGAYYPHDQSASSMSTGLLYSAALSTAISALALSKAGNCCFMATPPPNEPEGVQPGSPNTSDMSRRFDYSTPRRVDSITLSPAWTAAFLMRRSKVRM